jgi:hypothetical protein
MNLRETRVLAAIQKLGSPTTLEVAYECSLTTNQARTILNELEERGEIEGRGRRWAVPSVRLREPGHAPEWMIPTPPANVPRSIGLILAALGLSIAVYFIVKSIIGAFHG